ncbi:MAG: hypothetical protein ACFCUS_15610 [Rubrimonas sp.]|uniref:hypothetical protein n=1 Tax=Rubrimonas sp. TaxID=2036015 RepID=UPI002FDEBD47
MLVKSLFETHAPDVALFAAGLKLDQFLAAQDYEARPQADLGKWLPDRIAKLSALLLRKATASGAVSAERMASEPAYRRAQFEVLGLYMFSFVTHLAALHKVDPKLLGGCAARETLTLLGVGRFEQPGLAAAMAAYFETSARIENAQKILFVFAKWYGLFADPIFRRLEESHQYLAAQAG